MKKSQLRNIIKEEISSALDKNRIGTPEELKNYLYSRQSDIVGWVKEAIENHGEENISWEEDIKQWIADDAGEITPAKFQLTYNDTTYDGYDEYMFESVYEEFVQSTYNKFFGKTAEYDENQLELAEGKLLKERFQQLAGIRSLYENQIGLSPQSNEWLEEQVNMYFGGANEPGGEAEFEITRIEQGNPQKYDDSHLARKFLEELRGLGSIVVRYDDYIGDIKVTSDREGDAIVTWTWPS